MLNNESKISLHKDLCGCKRKGGEYYPIRYRLKKPYYRAYHQRNYIPKLVPVDTRNCVICDKKFALKKGKKSKWKRITCSPVCSWRRMLNKQLEWKKQQRTDILQRWEQKKANILECYRSRKTES